MVDAGSSRTAAVGRRASPDGGHLRLKMSDLATFLAGQCQTSDLVGSSPSWTDPNFEFDVANFRKYLVDAPS